jgi:peptidyl-prolyl cis-trans isomerase A (cyclophilin A)
MAQFGMNGDPRVSAAWERLTIPDDPVKQSNKRGMVTFAAESAPNTRLTQLFINYGDNANLDGLGFAPIGQVVDGMAVVDSLYPGYGEGAPDGSGPSQDRIAAQGNAYLTKEFPKLDYIRTARIVP